MKTWLVVAAVLVFQGAIGLAPAADLTPPKAGKPEILPLRDVKPGMHAVAWTVFEGNTAEPVPVEIIGVWQNAMGPRQHVIMAKMGGKAERTGVAGGMSGSPVYVDGKLIGAVALRLSQFSPDAICGITPIESMLEIQDFDIEFTRHLHRRSQSRRWRCRVNSSLSWSRPGERLRCPHARR